MTKTGFGSTIADSNQPGPRGHFIFMFSSAETKIYPAQNVKMPTIVGISTFISRIHCRFGLFRSELPNYLGNFSIYEQFKIHGQPLSM